MDSKSALVVTSIASPNEVLRKLAEGCVRNGARFIVIGDVPSPADFSMAGCDFYSIERQAQTEFNVEELLPKRHYSRKNLGYLLAARGGAEIIVETDDDNLPQDEFWRPRVRNQNIPLVTPHSWVNVYRYFTDRLIWPRGLPLDAIHGEVPTLESCESSVLDCPIQQGLANGDPDVDAIYRLLFPAPVTFGRDRRVALGRGCWCPFNSQNTTIWREAFPLLYLPAFCSPRMTDIWRSLVAQRIGWENGWHVLFHEATVFQQRNEHDLLKDLQDEIPGYLNNRRIGEALENLPLKSGSQFLAANLRQCYEELVRLGVLDPRELSLVDSWLRDIEGR